jgi:hypothetical protein
MRGLRVRLMSIYTVRSREERRLTVTNDPLGDRLESCCFEGLFAIGKTRTCAAKASAVARICRRHDPNAWSRKGRDYRTGPSCAQCPMRLRNLGSSRRDEKWKNRSRSRATWSCCMVGMGTMQPLTDTLAAVARAPDWEFQPPISYQTHLLLFPMAAARIQALCSVSGIAARSQLD